MGRVILCIGKTAEKPYYMEAVCQNAYTAEELCFLIRENAYLLDDSIVDKKLADWLGKECGLPDLSRELYGFIRSGCSVAAFVTVLLEQVGYCTRDEIASVGQLLKNNAGLSGVERQKIHADYLVQNGRYGQALNEYETLLAQMEPEELFRARILHNMGSACAGLFCFERAAEYFKAAAELSGEESDQEDYLAALRFTMPEREYVSMAGQDAAYARTSLNLEKRIARAGEQWKASEEGVSWKRMMEWKQEGKKTEYYEQAEEAIIELKETYRRNLS